VSPDVGDPPRASDVLDAAARLRGVANRTPVLTSRTLNERTRSEVLVKCESMQRAGAFKFRGAYNAISRLSDARKQRGVVAFSSGNHAQAVALVSRLLSVSATVVMPSNAPRAKLEATRGYGAEVVEYDPEADRREDIAARLCEEHGRTLIPPYDHPDVVAGQGTAALELLDDAGAMDALLVPCGGGGLLAGSALAVLARGMDCRVIGVEPELADDAARSFRSGTVQTVRNPATIADGLRTPSLGTVTWPIINKHVHDIITVTEDEIVGAMRFCWTRMKLVVEPSGAVAIAALLFRPEVQDGRVGAVISGGNVDLELACSLLA
jgi:threonine dehydratase